MWLILKIALDAARRKIGWQFLLFFAFQLQLIPFFVIHEFWPWTDRLALTLSIASLLILGTFNLLNERLLFQLPASRAQWWQARWVLGTVGASACAVAAVAVAGWRHDGRWPSFETWTDHLIISTAFCALLHSAYVRWLWKAGETEAATLTGTVAFTPILFGPPALPFIAARYLPHTLSAIAWPHALGLSVAGVLALPGLRFQPPIVARFRPRPPAPPQAQSAWPVSVGPSYFDRFVGWQQWLWREGRRQAVAQTVILVMMLAIEAAVKDPKGRSYVQGLQLMGFLPFAVQTRNTATFFLPAMAFIAAMPFGSRPWVANLRAMRCLPRSGWAIPLVPVAVGAVAAATWGTLLLVLHLLVMHTLPSRFPLDLLMIFAALWAVSESMRICIPESVAPLQAINMVGGMGLSIGLIYLGDDGLSLSANALTAVGGGTMLLSIALVRWSITRNPKIYQRRATERMV